MRYDKTGWGTGGDNPPSGDSAIVDPRHEAEFPLSATVDLPLSLKDAYLLLETIEVRLQLLRHSRALQGCREMFYYETVEAELEKQKDMIVEACQPLIKLLPTPAVTIAADEVILPV